MNVHRRGAARAALLAAAIALTGGTFVAPQPATAAVASYSDEGIANPFDVTAGPDGALWFTNSYDSSIGRITTSGAVTNFTDPGISGPEGITAGPDGALWFTNGVDSSIGRITTDGAVTVYTDPTILAPEGITAGPDGALWFTNAYNDSIGRITTDGTVSNFTDPSMSSPLGITAGPDGALWFTNLTNDSIGRITTDGTVTNYTGPRVKSPYAIAAGPDGALWFTNASNNSIGRVTTSGSVTVFGDSSIALPGGIVAGPDGALWFTNRGNNSIGRVTTSGAVTDYPVPRNQGAYRITVGADGALWFTGFSGASAGSIGRLGLPKANDACTVEQSCLVFARVAATTSSPAEALVAAGLPSGGSGTVKLTFAPGSMRCPSVSPGSSPVAKLATTGFSGSARLRVTITLRQTAETGPAQICFRSTVPFKSRSSSTSESGGTGLLLGCPKVRNVAPCVGSVSPVGTSVVVVVMVPGRGGSLSVQWPAAVRASWLSSVQQGNAGKPYAVQLSARGGTAPYKWTLVGGHLPAGVTLKASTGAIAGTPHAAGTFPVVVQATDAAAPPRKTAGQRVNIVVNP